jgi:hypothetical protein
VDDGCRMAPGIRVGEEDDRDGRVVEDDRRLDLWAQEGVPGCALCRARHRIRRGDGEGNLLGVLHIGSHAASRLDSRRRDI